MKIDKCFVSNIGLVTLLYAALSLSACGDGEEGVGISALCTRDQDCRKELVCEFSKCRAECARDKDCSGGACVQSQSDSDIKVCVSEKCQDDMDCPLALFCQKDRSCREDPLEEGTNATSITTDEGSSGEGGDTTVNGGAGGMGGSSTTGGSHAVGGSSATSGWGGSSSTSTDICSRQCAASAAAACSSQPSLSSCISACNNSRSADLKCRAEDAAFRECFASGPITCADGTAVITNKCSDERAALQKCRGTVECNDACIFANDGECDDCATGSTSSTCKLGTDCSDCGTRDIATICADPCDECKDTYCMDLFAMCLGNTNCRQLFVCIGKCDTGNTTCVSSCLTQYPSGRNGVTAYVNCMTNNCDSICSSSSSF